MVQSLRDDGCIMFDIRPYPETFAIGRVVEASAAPTPQQLFNLLFLFSEFLVAADLGPAARFLKGRKTHAKGIVWVFGRGDFPGKPPIHRECEFS
jgi:hypothetical protein